MRTRERTCQNAGTGRALSLPPEASRTVHVSPAGPHTARRDSGWAGLRRGRRAAGRGGRRLVVISLGSCYECGSFRNYTKLYKIPRNLSMFLLSLQSVVFPMITIPSGGALQKRPGSPIGASCVTREPAPDRPRPQHCPALQFPSRFLPDGLPSHQQAVRERTLTSPADTGLWGR